MSSRLRSLALIFFVLVFLYVAFEASRWPDVKSLVDSNPQTTAFVESAAKRIRAEGREAPQLRWVPRSRIAESLQHAVVASEDMNFFSHEGFDWGEIRVAVNEALDRKRLRGASTLTQQLAKNLWLTPARNPTRKLKEVLLTRELERTLSKQRILELYLNVVEFGDGIYGAENAARHYFGIPAADLSAHQAVQLAASLPAPKRWHPGSESTTYSNRVDRLAARVSQSQWIRKSL